MEKEPKNLNDTPNIETESSQVAAEQLEKIDKQRSLENAAELSARDMEDRAERAREEALEQAKTAEKKGSIDAKEKEPVHRRVNKKQKEIAYKQTMKQVRSELSAPEKIFSRLIHNKAIEKTSDVLGSTIARPNALLSGAVAAFILTTTAYLLAKNLGYALSGFETIGAFALGWVLGLLYDYLKILVTGKKS